jgi:GT2 family glycosyltransferase
MAKVSVIVVSWNAAAVLVTCLESLAGEGDEVVVIDNASLDRSADLVAERFGWVRLVRLDQNTGFAGGVNAGVRVATGDRLLLLNPDAEATPGAVGRLSRFLDDLPAAAAVAGRLVGTDGRPQRGWNVRRLPTPASLASELLLLDRVWPHNPWRQHRLALDFDDRVAARVEQPAAACLMVRRSVFAAVGGFDERFHPAWFEDVDFCRRLAAAGHEVWFCPEAAFRHVGGLAREQLGAAEFASTWYRNLDRYVAKHHGPSTRRLLLGTAIVGLAARAAASLVAGDRERTRGLLTALGGLVTGWRRTPDRGDRPPAAAARG